MLYQHLLLALATARASALNFAQAPLEKSTFTLVRYQPQRSFVTLRRFPLGSHTAQQICACGMQQMIVVKFAGE
jgi:hypothetical protein